MSVFFAAPYYEKSLERFLRDCGVDGELESTLQVIRSLGVQKIEDFNMLEAQDFESVKHPQLQHSKELIEHCIRRAKSRKDTSPLRNELEKTVERFHNVDDAPVSKFVDQFEWLSVTEKNKLVMQLTKKVEDSRYEASPPTLWEHLFGISLEMTPISKKKTTAVVEAVQEQLKREQAGREQVEREARERAEQEARERAQREERERVKRAEREEREKRERAEREEREKRERAELEERERVKRLEREAQLERERVKRAERDEREKRERAENEEREKLERAELEERERAKRLERAAELKRIENELIPVERQLAELNLKEARYLIALKKWNETHYTMQKGSGPSGLTLWEQKELKSLQERYNSLKQQQGQRAELSGQNPYLNNYWVRYNLDREAHLNNNRYL